MKRGVLVAVACVMVACGGRMESINPEADPIDPTPTTPPTPTPQPSTTSTAPTVPPPPVPKQSSSTGPCKIEHGTGRWEDGVCIPATCDAGYGTCIGTDVKSSKCELFVPWYADNDGDGFGAGKEPKEWGCANLDTWHGLIARNNDDCDDKDANVHPKQTKFFTTISKGGTWDYNCDGKVAREVEQMNQYCLCDLVSGQCSIGEGWWYSLPECGETGTFVKTDGSTCNGVQTKRVQGCR